MRFFRFLFVLPAMYLLIAAGINALKPERFVPALALVLAINLFFTHRYLAGARFHREDWRGLVNFISQNSPVDSSQIVFVRTLKWKATDIMIGTRSFLEELPELTRAKKPFGSCAMCRIYLIRKTVSAEALRSLAMRS